MYRNIKVKLTLVISILALGLGLVGCGKQPAVNQNVDVNANISQSQNDKENKVIINEPDFLFARQNGNYSIWAMKIDDFVQNLVIDELKIGNIESVTLSPTKDLIAYVSLEKTEKSGAVVRPREFGLRIIDLKNNEETLIGSWDRDEVQVGGYLKFSPDGQYLFYYLENLDDNSLYLNILQLSDYKTKIVKKISLDDNNISYGEMDWSDDSKSIVFIYNNAVHITDLLGNDTKIVDGEMLMPVKSIYNDEITYHPILSRPVFSNNSDIVYQKAEPLKDSEGKWATNIYLYKPKEKTTKKIVNNDNPLSRLRICDKFPYSNELLVSNSWSNKESDFFSDDPYYNEKFLLYNLDTNILTELYQGTRFHNPKILSSDNLLVEDISYGSDAGIYIMSIPNLEVKRLTNGQDRLR